MAKTCEIAPLGTPCVWGDGTKVTACCIHRLNAAGRSLLQSIPFFGSDFEDYHCPDFEPLICASPEEPDMLFLFSRRKRLAEIFEKWAEENGVATTPLGVITYLYIEGLLDTEKAQRLINQKEEADHG